MPKTVKVLSIFLASPGDVNDERGRVDSFVDEWNSLWSDDIGVHLRLIKWETYAYPAAGADGQDVINTQLGEEYDFFLGVMWKRFGTPTGRAASGTVEEFERALVRYRKSGNPQLMFYFKRADLGPGDDAEQLQAVQRFRNRLAKEGLLYWEFPASEQFGQLVRIHLTRHVQNWAKRYHERPATTPVAQSEMSSRYNEYLQNIKNHSPVLSTIITQFAQMHLEFITGNSQRAARIRRMSDKQLTEEFMGLTLIEIANAMERYADAAENFEKSFIATFSIFIESVLGAAAISIVFPAAKTGSLNRVLAQLRKKLHPIYRTMGDFITQLAKMKPQQSTDMPPLLGRSVSALEKFREHARFGERMLFEAEKLFNVKNGK